MFPADPEFRKVFDIRTEETDSGFSLRSQTPQDGKSTRAGIDMFNLLCYRL